MDVRLFENVLETIAHCRVRQEKRHQRAQSSQEKNLTDQSQASCPFPSFENSHGDLGESWAESYVPLLRRVSPRLTSIWPFSCHVVLMQANGTESNPGPRGRMA